MNFSESGQSLDGGEVQELIVMTQLFLEYLQKGIGVFQRLFVSALYELGES